MMLSTLISSGTLFYCGMALRSETTSLTIYALDACIVGGAIGFGGVIAFRIQQRITTLALSASIQIGIGFGAVVALMFSWWAGWAMLAGVVGVAFSITGYALTMRAGMEPMKVD
ncbi:hypothetical protein LCGC14_0282150 [marine sediment metagenome]|uniref:Uncharacterized protein n=1 Tax=marine sediment metagenome TaxID=412755 RepID=A0A0F9WGM6_9ZZZZ